MLFFKETAEEMVERLCEKWLKEKTFVISFPLTDQVLKGCIIRSLKITDEAIKKVIINENLSVSGNFIELHRENAVLLKLAQIFAKGVGVFPRPPKPSHRQHQTKIYHLRPVANM